MDSATAHSQEHYARILQRRLPRHVFEPVPARLLWLLGYYVVIVLSARVVLADSPWWASVPASVIAGVSLGTLGYLGHEIIHGSVVRSRRWISLFGGICMLPWGLHPRAWIAWHNRTHHAHTQHGHYDPDTFGWIHVYRRSRWYQQLERLSPGSRTPLSWLFLFYWFSFQCLTTVFCRPDIPLRPAERRSCRRYFVATYVVWIAAAAIHGAQGLLLLFVVPFAMSNFMMMSYIATNHFLNPLTEEVNDPLANSLTLRTPWLVAILHLQNNFHIEHHVLPHVNPRYAPLVAAELKTSWGDRYKEMTHLEALRRVYRTPRFYLTEDTLIHPRTRDTAPTI